MYVIQQSDLKLLKNAGVSQEDITHCVKVTQKALEIAQRIGSNLNLELIARAGLFHDLGKAKTHGIEHGQIGAELGKSLGLPPEITGIMEKHIRGGLSKEEAKELKLPVKDYSLKTIEEKIVIYADRLVDIIMDGIVPVKSGKETEEKFEEILKKYPLYGKNKNTLKRYLHYHREIQRLIKHKK